MQFGLCPGAEIGSPFVIDPGSLSDPSKRTFLRAAGMLMAGLMLPSATRVPMLQSAPATKFW